MSFWKGVLTRLGQLVRARAAGGDLADEHREYVRRLCLSPLDESAGEGYHRSTTVEKRRATGASPGHLKRSCRAKTTFENIKQFRRQYGRRADAVLHYDWNHWKRALQPDPKKRWSPLRIRAKAFFKRAYREDAQATEDWNLICKRQSFPRPVRVPDTGLSPWCHVHRTISNFY